LKDISRKNNNEELGTTKEVLINKIRAWVIEWYTDNMKQIIIETWPILEWKKWATKKWIRVGEFVTVEITKTIAFKLYGKIVVT
jgi:tRNA A37 methylthiotransferase MiaB